MTELHIAVQFGDLKTIKRIYRPFVNQRDAKGHTALMLAVMKCDIEKVKFLLTVEDVTLRNTWGLTAMDLALKMQNREIMTLLEEHCKTKNIDLHASQEALDRQFHEHVNEIKSYGFTDAELRKCTERVARVTGDVINDADGNSARRVRELYKK